MDHILKEGDIVARILFLDADDATLVRRYKETRRAHPLAVNGLPLDGIKQERVLLSEVKGRANFVYNTSNMKPKQLREKLSKNLRVRQILFLPLTLCPLALNMVCRLMRT